MPARPGAYWLPFVGALSVRFFQSIPKSASAHLNAIRAISALAVFFGHIRGLLLVDFEGAARLNLFQKAYYFFTGFGQTAVFAFFVLSGFFVGSTILRAFSEDRWTWKDYLLARLVRLEVVLLPALVITFALDRIGLALYPSLYRDGLGNILPLSTSGTVTVLFGNLLFLQDLGLAGLTHVPPFGTNLPLWSLSMEFWYYMIFPMIMLALWPRLPLGRRVAWGLLSVALLVFIGSLASWYFVVWLMGAALGWARPSEWLRSRPQLRLALLGLSLAAFGGLLVAIRLHAFPSVLHPIATGALVFAMTWLILNAPATPPAPSLWRHWYSEAANSLAGFSYTLYLVHVPIATLMAASFLPGPRWPADLPHMVMVTAFEVGLLAFSWILARYTEGRTDVIRGWVRKAISARVGAVSPG